MGSDPDDGEDEWRFSLEDLEEREDGEDREDREDAGGEATESPGAGGDAVRTGESTNGTAATNGASESSLESGKKEKNAEDGGGLDAGVAGRMDFSEGLEAGDIDVENALFVVLGVVLAIAFFVGFLNLVP